MSDKDFGRKKPGVPRAAAGLVALLGLAGCGLLARPTPDTAARDAVAAARTACRVYDLAPGEHHKPEADQACRSLRLMCDAEGGAPSE